MVRAFLVLLMLLTRWCLATEEKPPDVPKPGDVARYVRDAPVFRSHDIDRSDGDKLVAALDGGKDLISWGRSVDPKPGVLICFWGTERLGMTLELTSGKNYRLGFSNSGDLVFTPAGVYVVPKAAQEKVAIVLARVEQNLRREVTTAPRPLVYRLGTLDDGGTLSGVARLFYGSAGKWKVIYAANRKTIRDPDRLGPLADLTIPPLKNER